MFRALNRILQGTIRTVEPLQGADLWEVHMGASEPAWYCVGIGELRDTIDQPRAMAPTANGPGSFLVLSSWTCVAANCVLNDSRCCWVDLRVMAVLPAVSRHD